MPQDCRLTFNREKNRLYIHVFAWPFKQLLLPGYRGKVRYAQLLGDASEVPVAQVTDHQAGMEPLAAKEVILELPVHQPNAVAVIELFLSG